MLSRLSYVSSALTALLLASAATAQITPPPGHIFSTQLLSSSTQGCVAAGPGGTFVGVGPGFTANAQSVVLAKESGDLRLVASGFNSINDCAYDAASDTLYVTDNADNDDFVLTGVAQSGDTIFEIPSASSASGLISNGLELLPADSLSNAANIAVDASGDVFVSNAVGSGLGTVTKITGGSPAIFASGFDLASGLAFNPADGNLFIADFLSDFTNVELHQYDSAGAVVAPSPFIGPTTSVGSYDLAFDSNGLLLATGLFFGDVVSIDTTALTPAPTPYVSGLGFATGITVDPFTGRVQILSAPFPASAESNTLHRFTPIDGLFPGKGSAKSECVHELYGVASNDDKSTVCIDGDACDSDGLVNDQCLFPVGFCLNVDDPNFTECSSSNMVVSAEVTAKPFSPAITEAAARLAAALPVTDSTCVFSDGIVVPVKITGSGTKKDGKGKIKVKTATDAGQKDTDVIKLVCQPAP